MQIRQSIQTLEILKLKMAAAQVHPFHKRILADDLTGLLIETAFAERWIWLSAMESRYLTSTTSPPLGVNRAFNSFGETLYGTDITRPS